LLALPGQAHQQLVDLFLGQGVVAGLLAHVEHLGAAAGELQHAVAHQVIDHQRVGLADQARGAQGEELGVAGAGADQGHAAHRAGVVRAGGVARPGPTAADPLVEERTQGAGGRQGEACGDGRRHGVTPGIMTEGIYQPKRLFELDPCQGRGMPHRRNLAGKRDCPLVAFIKGRCTMRIWKTGAIAAALLPCTRHQPKAPPMTKAEFDKAAPDLLRALRRLPRRAAQGRHRQAADPRSPSTKGTEYLKVFIKYGSPAGMPNWGPRAS
jgi:hypothetical protein